MMIIPTTSTAITIQLEDHHLPLIDIPSQVNLRSFSVTNLNNTYPRPSYNAKSLSIPLAGHNPAQLLVLNANTLVRFFDKCSYHNINNTL